MSQTIREWMHENADEFDSVGDLVRAAIDQLNAQKGGKLYAMAREAMGQESDTVPPRSKKQATQEHSIRRRSFDQLRESYDLSLQIPQAIKDVYAEYIAGGGWLFDSEMLQEVCVRVPRARSRWSQYRDRESYAKMQAHTPDGKLIWIDPDYRDEAERMRAQ